MVPQCIKIWNKVFLVLCDNFHCEIFFQIFGQPFARPGYLFRRRIIILPPHNFCACGYCFDLKQCENILRQCIKVGYSSAQCIKVGYSSAQCIKMGYSWAQCSKIGYSSAQCIKIGYSSAPSIKIG